MTLFVNLATGFCGGIAAWFFTNYFGGPVLEFWKLRSEVHRFLYYYANISFNRPPPSRYVEEARMCFRSLGARLDALHATSPRLVGWGFVWRKYDLKIAASGLTGLSNSLAPQREAQALHFRVKAQRALRLPVAPEDQSAVDVVRRLIRAMRWLGVAI
jgi:hypothetical protein